MIDQKQIDTEKRERMTKLDEKRKKLLRDTVFGKIVNTQNPGEDIKVDVNGMPFIFKDSVETEIPRCVIATLNEAVQVIHDTKNIDMDEEDRKKVFMKLYHFFPCERPSAENDDVLKDIRAMGTGGGQDSSPATEGGSEDDLDDDYARMMAGMGMAGMGEVG